MNQTPLPAQGPVDVTVGRRWRVRVVCGHDCWLSNGRGDPARTLRPEYAKTWRSESEARRAAQIALAHYGREYGIELVPNTK